MYEYQEPKKITFLDFLSAVILVCLFTIGIIYILNMLVHQAEAASSTSPIVSSLQKQSYSLEFLKKIPDSGYTDHQKLVVLYKFILCQNGDISSCTY